MPEDRKKLQTVNHIYIMYFALRHPKPMNIPETLQQLEEEFARLGAIETAARDFFHAAETYKQDIFLPENKTAYDLSYTQLAELLTNGE